MFEHPIRYEEPVFRPPSEGQSLLLQVTIGCSHNLCTYCDMYRSKKYRVRSLKDIEKDLFRMGKRSLQLSTSPRPQKIFLCDGDALGVEDSLLNLCLEKIKFHLPWISRAGIYATASNILGKELASLCELKKNGLEIAYLGMETGSQRLLKKVVKDADSQEMVEASLKLKAASIKLSTIVMIGLGGREFFDEHALETAEIISKTRPDFLSFLVTRPVKGTPYYKMVERGNFIQLSEYECFRQMEKILENITLDSTDRIIFRANHVSNFYPIGGTLPKDIPLILEKIKMSQIKACREPLSLNFHGPM